MSAYMEIVYYLINFAILAGIIVLFARKIIVSIFADRRKKINADLDEAEKDASQKVSFVPPVLPELCIDRSPVEQAEAANEQRREKTAALKELECREIKRSGLVKLRNRLLDSFEAEVKKAYVDAGYSAGHIKADSGIIDEILSQIKLTPGDMAYLKRHDVLYVSLIGASKLDEELIKKVDKATTELLATVGGKTSFVYREDESLIGGLRLKIGDTVYDASVAEEIYHFKKSVLKQQIKGDEDVNTILDAMKQRVKDTKHRIHVYQRGRVVSVSDGICWLDGLSDIMYGEVIEFECGERGMVLDVEHDRIGCIIFGEYEHIESMSRVKRVGRVASVPVGDAMLGRVVDAIGNPIDSKGYIAASDRRPIECASPAILDRAPVKSPLNTGIKSIDALVPIGKGQRELIIGDRQTGKSAIALDTIINQKGKNVICIYVAIGQKETTVSDIKEKLETYGAMDYTVIVAATASGSAAMQYIAPFAATAIGEHFMYEGKDVLIVYDDLSKHAVAYRELSLLLQRPSGREAYPGDIFYLHSRLLERSAHLSEEMGGGSLTALPIIETLAGDISAYIPTNVISITDGQIFLDSELFHEGQRPAVNVGLSVSRVGGSAQTKLMKQVASSIRTRLAQYRELAEFTQFGTDVDETTRKTLDSGKRLTEALKQARFAPLDDWKQALLIYAVSIGFADGIPIEKFDDFEAFLFDDFIENQKEITEILKSGNKMTSEVAERVKSAISETVKRYR